MSALQFIVGRAGYDHFSALISKLERDHKDDVNNGHKDNYYFYLVPNHIKFKSEINTLERLRSDDKKYDDNKPYAQINVQILSLTRMGWFFFNQAPMQQHQQIDDSGVNMLLYLIVQKHAKELPLFSKEKDQTGFILKITQEISEMQTSQISADDLATLYKQSVNSIKRNDDNDDLIKKMHDFLIIYKAYEKATNNKYISKPGVLNRLCDYLAKYKDLDKCHFYISGFSQFTAQENRLVQILIKRSAGVVIDLNMNESCIGNKLKPFDLFYRPLRLYYRLANYAKDMKIKQDGSIIAGKPDKNQMNPDVLKLEQYWINAYQNHITPGNFKGTINPKSVQVVQTDNTYSELANVAIKIRQMVTTGKYRYSDFLILTRHLDKFSNVIKPIFHLQQIPIFNDLQHQMILHPVVRLIGDLFSIYHAKDQRQYTYRDVMDLLKTGLLIPKTDDGTFMNVDDYYHDVYLCENFILQNGYWGNQWLQDEDWQYSYYDDFTHMNFTNDNLDQQIAKVKKHGGDVKRAKQILDQVVDVNKRINFIKDYVKNTLAPFFDQLDQAKTCRDAATILYNFLAENGADVVDRLKHWRDNEINAHQLSYAGQNNQVWGTFCNLLDSCVDVLGDKKFDDQFTVNDFWSLLKVGFESASYSQIPPTFDQVVISESKIVQMKGYKVVFMIGSTDDVMPDHTVNNTLFSNTDRADLKPAVNEFNNDHDKQCYLNDGSDYQVNNEPYLNDLAFMSANQKVIFTYSLKNDEEGNGDIKESPYVAHMQDAFGIPTQRPDMMPIVRSKGAGIYTMTSHDNYLGSPMGTLHHLIQALHAVDSLNQHIKNKKDWVSLPADWQYIKTQLCTDTKTMQAESKSYGVDIPHLTKKLLQSVHYKNEPTPLKSSLVDQLYGTHLNISISQLESFYRNPYEYFLKYGLKLKPRQILGQSISSNFGQFYHAALKRVLIILRNKYGTEITQASQDELANDVDDIVHKLIYDPSYGDKYYILRSSSRMKYVENQLRTIIKAMVRTIYLQSIKYTDIRPWRMELPFTTKRTRDPHLPALSFKVQTNQDQPLHDIYVNGRFDRVDRITNDQTHNQYYGIVDYKSSKHKFNYGQIYAGTEMQMMTYLDALYTYLRKYKSHSYVFGALYSLIQDPILTPKNIRDVDNIMHSQNIWNILLQQQQYNGVLIDGIGMPEDFDKNLRAHQPSSLYAGLKKKKTSPGFAKVSQKHLLTKSEFDVIRTWIEHKIKEAGKDIYSGDDALKPAKWGNRNALTYSEYKPIMCFDHSMGNQYNEIKPIYSPSALVKKIQQAEDGKDK